MALSGLARGDGPSGDQVAAWMQPSANPCAQCIKPLVPQPSRGVGYRLKSIAMAGLFQVREQALQRATASPKEAYFEVEGRPGSQPDPHPPPESGQGAPEPVRTAEVRQRCDTQQVNSVTLRERHSVVAESDTPVLFPAFLHFGWHNPSWDHNREGQAPSISSQRRDPHSFPARPQTGHA